MKLIKPLLFFTVALLGSIVAAVYLGGSANADADNKLTLSDEALDQRIHDYILSHPEVIVESIQKWQAQQQQTQVQQANDLSLIHI